MKLGPVLGVQEVAVSGDDNVQRLQPWEVASDAAPVKPNEIITDTMSGGSYRVRLMVASPSIPALENRRQKQRHRPRRAQTPMMKRSWTPLEAGVTRHRWIAILLAFSLVLAPICRINSSRADEVLPKHITVETLKAVRSGLEYLARSQADDGAWRDGQGGQAYPVAMSALACTALLANGNSPTRGRYAEQLKRGTEYLLQCAAANKSGLITGPIKTNGQPMHGHGFALMYLASVYGMETNEENARQFTMPWSAA